MDLPRLPAPSLEDLQAENASLKARNQQLMLLNQHLAAELVTRTEDSSVGWRKIGDFQPHQPVEQAEFDRLASFVNKGADFKLGIQDIASFPLQIWPVIRILLAKGKIYFYVDRERASGGRWTAGICVAAEGTSGVEETGYLWIGEPKEPVGTPQTFFSGTMLPTTSFASFCLFCRV